MCDAHLNNEPTGLCCTRTDPHENGHCYQSTSGQTPPPQRSRVDGWRIRRGSARQVRSQICAPGGVRAARQGHRHGTSRDHRRRPQWSQGADVERAVRVHPACLHRVHRAPADRADRVGGGMKTHRYNSGVGWDTAPSDPIFPCCEAPRTDPVHGVHSDPYCATHCIPGVKHSQCGCSCDHSMGGEA